MGRGVIDDQPGRLIFIGMSDRAYVRPEARITLSRWPDTLMKLEIDHCVRIEHFDDLRGIESR